MLRGRPPRHGDDQRHQVENVLTNHSLGAGFRVVSDRNRLRGNVARGGRQGFQIVGSQDAGYTVEASGPSGERTSATSNWAAVAEDPDAVQRASRMADWELDTQLEDLVFGEESLEGRLDHLLDGNEAIASDDDAWFVWTAPTRNAHLTAMRTVVVGAFHQHDSPIALPRKQIQQDCAFAPLHSHGKRFVHA